MLWYDTNLVSYKVIAIGYGSSWERKRNDQKSTFLFSTCYFYLIHLKKQDMIRNKHINNKRCMEYVVRWYIWWDDRKYLRLMQYLSKL